MAMTRNAAEKQYRESAKALAGGALSVDDARKAKAAKGEAARVLLGDNITNDPKARRKARADGKRIVAEIISDMTKPN